MTILRNDGADAQMPNGESLRWLMAMHVLGEAQSCEAGWHQVFGPSQIAGWWPEANSLTTRTGVQPKSVRCIPGKSHHGQPDRSVSVLLHCRQSQPLPAALKPAFSVLHIRPHPQTKLLSDHLNDELFELMAMDRFR